LRLPEPGPGMFTAVCLHAGDLAAAEALGGDRDVAGGTSPGLGRSLRQAGTIAALIMSGCDLTLRRGAALNSVVLLLVGVIVGPWPGSPPRWRRQAGSGNAWPATSTTRC
jgi:hypothetical protein